MESEYSTAPKRKFPKWLETFIPNKEVKVTPVIICLNLLVWLVMILNGVSPYFPSAEEAMKWGATNAELVADGDYWRLITSNYIHFGFLHLGMNMLALHNVGRLLERFIGPWRFGILYTFTGIFASSVSIWWNQYGVGAGASGAILGIVGVLAALLTTNLIDKSIRLSMLKSLAISIGLTLLIGISAHIDNAAHIAGLLSGALGGYLIYPELKMFFYQRKKQWYGLIAAFLIIAGATVWFATHTKGGKTRTPQQIVVNFEDKESYAMQRYGAGDFTTADDIEKNITEVYRVGLLQMDSILSLDLNPESRVQAEKLKKYVNERYQQWSWVVKSKQGVELHAIDSANAWATKAELTKLDYQKGP